MSNVLSNRNYIIDLHNVHEVTSECKMFMVTFSFSSCSYLEKFTDFLRLFVSVHLRRIESSPQFPIVEFLGLLFKYTFNQVMITVTQALICLCSAARVVDFCRFPAKYEFLQISKPCLFLV